jgi:hypothetical protein
VVAVAVVVGIAEQPALASAARIAGAGSSWPPSLQTGPGTQRMPEGEGAGLVEEAGPRPEAVQSSESAVAAESEVGEGSCTQVGP